MEYALIVGRMAESMGVQLRAGLGAVYDKLFDNPLLLALVGGGVLLVCLWAFRSR